MSKDGDDAASKVSQITASSQFIEVGGVEFEIKPLSNEEFLNYVTNGQRQNVDEEEITVELVTHILQKDDPNITEDEIRDAPMELLTKVLDAIEQVNGLEDFLSKAGNQEQRMQR